MGNLFSLKAALQREGVQTRIVSDLDGEGEADALVLPGVGNFREASRRIPSEAIRRWALGGRPLLGVCLGLQLFFERSAEGDGKGLSLLPGEVRCLPPTVKVPHMGWNQLRLRSRDGILDGVPEDPWAYFVHSYYPATEGDWVRSTTEYGVEFPSTIEWKNVWGLQFHPEKSGRAGRTIVRNFVRMVKK